MPLVRACRRALRSGLLLLPLLAARTASDPQVLLREDFSGPLEVLWTLFGEPLPFLEASFGNPAPSFDNHGDNLWISGAVSRERFEAATGLVLSCDLYVPSNQRGAWIDGALVLSWDTVGVGVDGENPQDILFDYCYCGEANWERPHLGGVLRMVVTLPDGSRESREEIHVAEYLDGWHRFSLSIEPDRTVAFRVDDREIGRSSLQLPEDLPPLAVILGNRSTSWGRVYHDNVLLTRP